MRKQIVKRLEALERATEKKVFARAPTFSYAIAYFLGGAKHVSDPHAYARALGYQNRAELCRAFAELLSEPSSTLNRYSGLPARTFRARRKLLAKFGFDLDGATPATLADALYRIARTLPEEWRAEIVSGERKMRAAEARADPILRRFDEQLRAGERSSPERRCPGASCKLVRRK